MGRSQTNWRLYNTALKERGKITLWFSRDTVKSWYNQKKTGKRGASPRYSQAAVDVLSMIRFKFKMTLRETEGFACSLLDLLGTKIQTPDYTTLSRRLKDANRDLQVRVEKGESVHVVIDSTGLKVFGEGEWKVRQHGYSKRRTWMKLHLGVNEANSQILSMVLTDNSYKDNEVFEELMDNVSVPVDQATGDGAYDAKNCWGWAEENGVKGVFSLRNGATLKSHGNAKTKPSGRDKLIRLRRKIGKKRWKQRTRYSRRSLAETAMYRFKALLGSGLGSRATCNQVGEALIKCRILNMMPVPSVLQ